MRLRQAFIRLPIRFDADAIARELTALGEGVWRQHPEDAAGNTALPIVAVGGDPSNDDVAGRMLPTPHLAALPYTRRLLASLDSVVGRSRFMRIEEEGVLARHVDTNYYWRDRLRVHFPVVTRPDVEFVCDDETAHMAAGEVWVFDTWRRHGVSNPTDAARIHLVVDTVGSASLWDLIDRPDREIRRIVPGVDALPDFVTERFNHPRVMTPWEVDWAIRALLVDVAQVDAACAVSAEDALRGWQRQWRAEWAQSGDDPAARGRFEVLRLQGDHLAQDALGNVRLRNRIPAIEALRQHVLRPALETVTRPVTSVAVRATSSTDARGAADGAPGNVPSSTELVFERPIFVVSSPRSGSTLLFETLARARGVMTIGGESHAVIESIPQLHPSARGWSSNRLDVSDATPRVVDALASGFVAELRDRDGRKPAGGSVRMLEKTPKNALRIPFLTAAFPDALFVYLYRDPRETVSSMLDAWRSGRFITYANLPGWDNDQWSLLLVPGWRELSGRPLAEVVTTQWATTTSILLDDLEALDPDRWCVASYDRLLSQPQDEVRRICEFCDLEWDGDLHAGELPLSRHTLTSPSAAKWQRNADELEPYRERLRDVALRAHDLFARPPRTKAVPPRPSTEAQRAARVAVPASVPPEQLTFDSVHTASFPPLLADLGASLVVSTYQSGRLIVVRTEGSSLNTHFRVLAVPMGLATRPGELAVGAKSQVLRFQNQPTLAARLDPPDRHDAVFVPRAAHTTGDIRIHDLAYAGDDLWAVNTRFSCLCTFDDDYSFVPRWRPPFVTALAPEDRCHLNGMAVVDGAVRFVSALGTTDSEGGWREHKTDGGVVLDVPSGEVVVEGLCMPHSPRWHDGRLWLLESGNGGFGYVDLERGRFVEVTRVPGFTRGLSFAGPFAFVGLSQVRESLFEGIPLKADGVERSCGVWVIDTRSGQTVAFLRFEGIVQELFEVLVLPRIRYPEIVEPGAEILDNSFVLPDAALADVPR